MFIIFLIVKIKLLSKLFSSQIGKCNIGNSNRQVIVRERSKLWKDMEGFLVCIVIGEQFGCGFFDFNCIEFWI